MKLFNNIKFNHNTSYKSVFRNEIIIDSIKEFNEANYKIYSKAIFAQNKNLLFGSNLKLLNTAKKQDEIKSQKDLIISLYKQGKTQQQIADTIGCSSASICTYLKKWRVD